MKAAAILALIGGAMLLAGCAGYGYRYAYDPYRGPYGYHVGPGETPPPQALAQPCLQGWSGPSYGGWRGPYVAGPVCVAPAPAQATASAGR